MSCVNYIEENLGSDYNYRGRVDALSFAFVLEHRFYGAYIIAF